MGKDIAERVGRTIRQFFESWRSGDQLAPGQIPTLDKLESRLVTETLRTLTHLHGRYHVEIEPLLEMLRERRFRFVFGNPQRVFQKYTAKEIDQWATVLSKAREILDCAGPLLLTLWAEAFQRSLARPDSAAARLRDAKAAFQARAAVDRDVAQACEQVEELALWDLAAHGDIVAVPGSLTVLLPEELDIAIKLLGIATMTFGRLDLAHASHPDGRPVFGPGRRREFVLEAECAHDLVDFFRRETNRALYQHVAALLVATYPETCGTWGARGKSAKDRVKELLKAYADVARPQQGVAIPPEMTS